MRGPGTDGMGACLHTAFVYSRWLYGPRKHNRSGNGRGANGYSCGKRFGGLRMCTQRHRQAALDGFPAGQNVLLNQRNKTETESQPTFATS